MESEGSGGEGDLDLGLSEAEKPQAWAHRVRGLGTLRSVSVACSWSLFCAIRDLRSRFVVGEFSREREGFEGRGGVGSGAWGANNGERINEACEMVLL